MYDIYIHYIHIKLTDQLGVIITFVVVYGPQINKTSYVS